MNLDFDDQSNDPSRTVGFVDVMSAITLIFILFAFMLVIFIYKKRLESEKITNNYSNVINSLDQITVKYTQLKDSLNILVNNQSAKYNSFIDSLRTMSKKQKALEFKYKFINDSLLLEINKHKARKIIIPNELKGRVFFESGKANIRKEFLPLLSKFYKMIQDSLNSGTYNFVQVEGHTDDVPINTYQFYDNWDLGASRAIAVVRYLEERGIPSKLLSATSHSEYKPYYRGKSDTARSKNRRIEVLLLKK